MNTWTNWAGLSTSHPSRELSPSTAEEVAAAVRSAAEHGSRIKMPGSGHSFTAIAATEDVLLRPEELRGFTRVDRESMTVTVLAGTPLHEVNATLEHLGLSLHNMGDIDQQTVAGATSTGTHGTGGVVASLSAQIAGLELITGDGSVLQVSATEHPEVFAAARVGLGALGIITTVTMMVEPLFVLEADEGPVLWDQALAEFDALAEENHHVEMYWFPHTDRLLRKRNNRVLDDPEPLSRFSRWLDDDFLSNRVLGLALGVGSRRPSLVPRINEIAGQVLSARRYSDAPHRVFTTPRTTRFREMEYAVPREAGIEALREVRALIERRDWRIGFPLEIRTAPADDITLSPAAGRDTMYLAFHVPMKTDHTAYFEGVEDLLRGYDGRPHWGKLHTRTAADLAPTYPGFEDFLALRDRLDPQRLFTNPYLDRVLGP